jgi:transposase
VPTVPVSGRADLSDAQWAVLEPLLPKGKKLGRPRRWERRRLIDGIRWRLIAVPGRLTRHAGTLILRLPPGHSLLAEVLARLRALPAKP